MILDYRTILSYTLEVVVQYIAGQALDALKDVEVVGLAVQDGLAVHTLIVIGHVAFQTFLTVSMGISPYTVFR